MPRSTHHFDTLPSARQADDRDRSLRICVASVDIAGPYHCGGVGAAYQGLALALAHARHDVTVLYTHHAIRGGEEHWRRWYESRGIRFMHAPQPAPGRLWYARRKDASFTCWQHLRDEQPYDVIHFHEWLGLPYYSLLAKRQGLAFHDTLLCVGTHGAMRWSRAADGHLARNREDLVVDYMERRSVELADVVISPSRYLLEWMHEDGWQLPARSYIAQNILALPDGEATVREAGSTNGPLRPVSELVFFGRLDRRKGLLFFFDVLDRLAQGDAQVPAVIFLGSSVAVAPDKTSESLIRERAARWPFRVEILTDCDRDRALQYLAEPGRLAVIPSLADNLPCTVHECVQAGIPFVASDVGGIPEIVDPADHERTLLPLDVARFAERLRELLETGQAPAAARVEERKNVARWLAWHAQIAAPGDPRSHSRTQAAQVSRPKPTVSVCIAHYERPALLAFMLESLRAQTSPPLEVVLVDDGSRSPAARAALDALEVDFRERGWTLLRRENAGPGAARHAAAEAARGEYLCFADDDDWAEENALETFARVAAHTGADVLVSAYRGFEGSGRPRSDTPVKRWHLPLGPALAAGVIYPELGGTMIFVRRQAYFDCGGFPVERDVDEDWELLLELVAAGHRLEVVPEPLFWYRETNDGRSRTDNRFLRAQSRIRLFERMLPVDLRDLVQPAFAQLAGAGDAADLRRTDRVREAIERAAERRAKSGTRFSEKSDAEET